MDITKPEAMHDRADADRRLRPAMPVMALHVHDVLRFGPYVVELVAGGQFLAAVVSRFWAGRLTDTRGPKLAMAFGPIAGALGGAFYLVSLAFLTAPLWQ